MSSDVSGEFELYQETDEVANCNVLVKDQCAIWTWWSTSNHLSRIQSSLLINEMCTKIQKCGGIEKLAFNPIMCHLTTDTWLKKVYLYEPHVYITRQLPFSYQMWFSYYKCYDLFYAAFVLVFHSLLYPFVPLLW